MTKTFESACRTWIKDAAGTAAGGVSLTRARLAPADGPWRLKGDRAVELRSPPARSSTTGQIDVARQRGLWIGVLGLRPFGGPARS